MVAFRSAKSPRRALLPVCAFFLLVALSSWLSFPSLLDRAGTELSLFLVSLPDGLQVGRETMFVLCNVIMAIIARDSGFLSYFMGEGSRRSEGDSPEVSCCSGNAAAGFAQVSVLVKGSDCTKEAAAVAAAETEEAEVAAAAAEEAEEEEDDDEEENGEDEEEEDEEEDGDTDMDELNKKFEDFIWKVKRDRELEALQMVLV